MQFKQISFVILASIVGVSCVSKSGSPVYLQADQPVEKRVDDLLSRMTLEEKVAQMSQYVGLEHMKSAEQDISLEEMEQSHARGFYPGLTVKDVEAMTRKGLVGSFLHVVTAEEANYLQTLALESRLKVPVIIGIDAIHGNGLVSGCTVYPSPITQAASFDPLLVERSSRETAREMRATGSHWSFTPNVEVARDTRWGRIGETFGEDPHLVTLMGVATVRGLQTDDFTGDDKVVACTKHFVGGSQPVNGINGAPCDVSERTLHEVFYPPFRACVEAGTFTFMTAHNELNGVPCHANKYLMTDMLREQWGFKGFVVSDWMDIERLQDYHSVAPTLKDAYFLTVDAGMDMHMHGPHFADKVIELVNEKKLSEKRIDNSVRKILEAKFRLGLFENPFVDITTMRSKLFTEEHQKTALEMARKGIVLLKNEKILPLNLTKSSRILVTGPNADNQSILGDWALQQPNDQVTTIYEGIKNMAGEANVTHVPFDWNIRTMDPRRVDQAVAAARGADVAVVVVGETSQRYYWNEKTCGENSDRYDLSLVGLQQELVERIAATGTPTVVVLVNGRPLTTEWIADNIPAIVEAWEPGALGGQALAEILFGKVNPSGKLPITIPRHSGQIGCYYNHKFTNNWFPYSTGNSAPLFAFGYGLSYSLFEFSPITLSADKMQKNGSLIATVTLKNSGVMAGEEVVQLYLRDCYSQVTRPVKELKEFSRVALNPGESKEVSFTVTPEMLKFYDLQMKLIAEPGEFTLFIGNSSRDADLQKATFTLLP